MATARAIAVRVVVLLVFEARARVARVATQQRKSTCSPYCEPSPSTMALKMACRTRCSVRLKTPRGRAASRLQTAALATMKVQADAWQAEARERFQYRANASLRHRGAAGVEPRGMGEEILPRASGRRKGRKERLMGRIGYLTGHRILRQVPFDSSIGHPLQLAKPLIKFCRLQRLNVGFNQLAKLASLGRGKLPIRNSSHQGPPMPGLHQPRT